MIRQGKLGSFNLYWKGELLSSFPIHNETDIDDYIYQGTYTILHGMKDPNFKNYKLKHHIEAYMLFCNQMFIRKRDGKRINSSDHQLLLSSMMALEKLKIIDSEYDNLKGYFISPRKKRSISVIKPKRCKD